MPDLSDTIADAAAGPQEVSVDGQTAVERPLDEIITADKYLAQKNALTGTNASGGPRSGWNSLRPARVIPPGAT